MAKLVWDATGKRYYETGVDHGVLYPMASGTYQTGVAWNGLSAVTESPSGAEASPIYADNIKYLNLMSVEELALTIEAYTYPDEFEACDGSASIATGVTIGQQPRSHFAFCYRTLKGNDEDGNNHGYLIHIVYDCLASPTERANASVNDSPEAITFSWEISTTPISIEGFQPTAAITIDSTKVDSAKLTKIENALYGTDTAEPAILTPAQIVAIINGNSNTETTNP